MVEATVGVRLVAARLITPTWPRFGVKTAAIEVELEVDFS